MVFRRIGRPAWSSTFVVALLLIACRPTPDAPATSTIASGGPSVENVPTPAKRDLGEGIVITISKSELRVGNDPVPVVRLPADRGDLATRGVDATYKRSADPRDLYIVPLANALVPLRELDKKIRIAGGLDPGSSEAIIVADANTPYRLLFEVLFTLGQNEFGKYHLMVLGAKGATRPALTADDGKPLPEIPGARVAGKALGLVVLVTDKGYWVRTSSGSIAPGCAALGPGVTVPKVNGAFDLAGLVACARRLKGTGDETDVTLTANPGETFLALFDTVDALRGGPTAPLFPDVHFGVAK